MQNELQALWNDFLAIADVAAQTVFNERICAIAVSHVLLSAEAACR
jgi:hypothetical protein